VSGDVEAKPNLNKDYRYRKRNPALRLHQEKRKRIGNLRCGKGGLVDLRFRGGGMLKDLVHAQFAINKKGSRRKSEEKSTTRKNLNSARQ